MNIDTIHAISALESSDTELKQRPSKASLHHMHAKFIFKAFSKLPELFYIRSTREGGTVCDAYPDAVFKVKER